MDEDVPVDIADREYKQISYYQWVRCFILKIFVLQLRLQVPFFLVSARLILTTNAIIERCINLLLCKNAFHYFFGYFWWLKIEIKLHFNIKLDEIENKGCRRSLS